MNEKITSLNRFISRYTDKYLPFFKLLRKNTLVFWNEECEHAFQNIKAHLGRVLVLLNPLQGELVYL